MIQGGPSVMGGKFVRNQQLLRWARGEQGLGPGGGLYQACREGCVVTVDTRKMRVEEQTVELFGRENQVNLVSLFGRCREGEGKASQH